MAEAISQWRKRIKSITRDCTVDYLSSEFCFRDPIRPIKNNSGIIYSPADGIVIDVSKVDSVDQLIYTKWECVPVVTVPWHDRKRQLYLRIDIPYIL